MDTYNINVSRRGFFFCRVIHECILETEALGIAYEFRSRFPESQGWKVSVTVRVGAWKGVEL